MRAFLFAFLIVAFAIPAPPAQATVGTIQPGDELETSVGSCTLSFVYDGTGALAGKVYLGTAAHCVGKVGDAATSRPYAGFGTVAYVGDADVVTRDFAFIEVKPAFVPFVRAAVKGHPSFPTGSTVAADTAALDQLQFSGYGMGFESTPATQERRIGILDSDTAQQYTATGITNFGDSGGPIVHVPTGKALGIISQLCVGPCTDVGPTVEGILAKANAAGFTVRLRIV